MTSPETLKAAESTLALSEILGKVFDESGWRGHGPKSDTHFYCEFCKVDSEDSSFEGMGHLSSCLMVKIKDTLTQISALRGKEAADANSSGK